MPEIAWGIYTDRGAVKTHMTACGVIKTIPNNHPGHVGYDTRPQVPDTRPVDLEKTYWNSMEADWRNCLNMLLLIKPFIVPVLSLHNENQISMTKYDKSLAVGLRS